MKEYYKQVLSSTPSYVFDTDVFASRIRTVAQALPGIPLCYSIKANPFLVTSLPAEITHLEVCSPGELLICEESGVDLSRIIFSGVNKTAEDVARAMADSVDVFTAESLLHLRLIEDEAKRTGKKVRLILRLSSGNQFGMDEQDIRSVLAQQAKYEGVQIVGIHYYAGTQKKKASVIQKELDALDVFLMAMKTDYAFVPEMVEYGPGMAVDYFGEDRQAADLALLGEVAPLLMSFADKYPLSIEMGRFFASDCGTYFTKMMDTKVTHEVNYAICDGGIHHLKYYGQTMSMQAPPIEVLNPVDEEEKFWCLCGSLCTVADVLVRKVPLKGAGMGSLLAFGRCGAYSVTEGSVLFLSRTMPEIYLYSEEQGLRKVRPFQDAYKLNTIQ